MQGIAQEKILYRLSVIVSLTYAVVVFIGLFMPLQTDEVAYLLLNDRALIDGRHVINLYPECGKQQFSIPLPWIWYLPAYFNDLTYGRIDNPLWIRIGGIVQFFIWLILWLAITVKLFVIPRSRWVLAFAVMLAFLGLDALPLALLVNRPEQILLIGTGLFVGAALYAKELSTNTGMRLLCLFLLIFASMDMHASHPKSIFLLPLELAMIGVFLHEAWGRRTVTLAGMGIVLWIALQSQAVIAERLLQCPDSASMRHVLFQHYLSPSLFLHTPFMFILCALLNLVFSIFTALSLHCHLESSGIWIPLSMHPFNAFTKLLLGIWDIAAWLMYASFLFIAVITCYRQTVTLWVKRSIDTLSSQTTPLVALLGLGVILAALGVFFIFVTPMFYSVSFSIPLLLLASLFALRLKYGTELPNHPSFTKFATILLTAAILNHALLFYRYEAFVSLRQEHISTLTRPIMNIPAWGYEERRRTIEELASECNIGTGNVTQHVVLDDMTYLVFRNTYEPIHITYIWPVETKSEIQVYFKPLNDYGSDGIIAECGDFPSKLLPLTTKRAGMCCIPKSTIKMTVMPTPAH